MNMSDFQEFLCQLFDLGTIVFRSPPAPLEGLGSNEIAVLADAYQSHRLSVGGPLIPFDESTAIAAADLLRQSSWALMNRRVHLKEINKRWNMPGSPTTAAQHLSADLTLRYLPRILMQARALDSSDPLVDRVVSILKCWPLSGVLSDIGDAPSGSLEFAGHPGLMLLYAERLIVNDRPAWRPATSSRARAYVDLVHHQLLLSRSTAPVRRNEVHGG